MIAEPSQAHQRGRSRGRRIDRRRGFNVGVPAAAALFAWALTVPARAATADAGVSSCPTREAIEDAVRALINLSSGAGGAEPPRIGVRDLGDRYTVSVKGSTREFSDESRDCTARARAAAVFVALVLPRPLAKTDEPAALPAAPDERAPPPVSSPPPTRAPPASQPAAEFQGTDIEVGAAGAVAPRTGGSQVALTGEVRVVVTRGGWAVGLGGLLPAASTIDVEPTRVREVRTPIDLSLRRGWPVGWFRTGLELGALAAICRYQQLDMMNATTTTRIELGVRAAASIAAESPRVGLYLRAFAELVPITRQIAVEPRGPIGRTSAAWVGAAVGVTVRFH